MSQRVIISLLFYIASAGLLPAQSSYQFTRYTQEDGLATGSITEINKDKAGFLWLMSENGIMRFDGYDFKIFRHYPNDSNSIPASNYYEMQSDETGNILFRCEKGIYKYIPSDGNFKKIINHSDSIQIFSWGAGIHSFVWATSKYHLLKMNAQTGLVTSYALPEEFNRNEMRFYAGDSTTIWLYNQQNQLMQFSVTENRFSFPAIYYRDSVSHILKNKPLLIFRDHENTTRLFTHEGLYKYNSGKNRIEQYVPLLIKDRIQANALIAGNYIFTGTSGGNLLRVDMKDGSTQNFHIINKATESNLQEFIFYGLYPARDGSIWISTSNAGAFHYFPSTGNIEQLISNPGNLNSLISNSTDFILEDENNVVWINCAGRGIVKVEKEKPILDSYIPIIDKKSMVGTHAENIRSISAQDNEHLLIGTLGGLFQFNKSSHEFQSVLSPVDNKPVLEANPVSKIITDSKGNVWITSWGSAVIYFLNKKFKSFARLIPESSGVPGNFTIRALYIDSLGYLWVGSDANVIYRANLNLFDPAHPEKIVFKQFKGTISKTDTLIFTQCFTITESKKGTILFGTQNGLYKYRYLTEKFQRYLNRPGDSKSLSDNNVRAIWVDNSGIVWIGTNRGGLNRFDDSIQTFKSFTVEDGLPDNTIYSILEDKKGNLWLGTNKGLCRFNPKTLSCRNYSLKDGIQNYEYNTNAAFKTLSGSLAFGGRTGFNFFNPDSLEIISQPPKIVFTQFKVFDKEFPLTNSELNLKYNENLLSFQFAALSFFRNKENQYAYKLEGLDADWIYCGDRRFTNYAHLAHGQYIFRVKASNCFGIWNENGIELKINIATPWFYTWWFIFLILITVSGMVYALFRFRLQQKLKLQHIRNKIARDLHDEIGSNLSSISLFSAVAKEKSADAANPVSVLLKKISDYTQSSQEAMNDIVWMITTRNDKFENIIVRMRTLAAEMFETKNVNLHLNFDERLNNLRMGMDERKNFFLIYKESVNNIVKYSECKNVWVDLLYQKSVVFRIRDDGIGFDVQKNIRGNGIINMKKRSEALLGKLIIQSEPNYGTTVELKFRI